MSNMDRNTVRYPLGIQTFSEIIEGGYLYVDKTEYVYRMTRSKYVFLSRPRRFGKSLLVSTLKSYFDGRKDLFAGLAIVDLEREWLQHPVLHFSMASAKHGNVEDLRSDLNRMLSRYEDVWGRSQDDVKPNQRLMGLIERAHRQTGRGVVLLIDEYDAPLLDVIHDEGNLNELRKEMQGFFSPIKDCDEHLRFVFITGITKFTQLSIFSELNNLSNISMLPDYAGVCGITDGELEARMGEGIEALAGALRLTRQQAIDALKANYDGYHFAWPSPDVYNPFSLLNALANRNLKSYWFESGTPTALVQLLRKFDVSPSELGGVTEAVEEDFDAPTESVTSITPLLYQSGYITIKGCEQPSGVYSLGVPNREIRVGLMRSLMPNYLGAKKQQGNTTAAKMGAALLGDRMDDMLRLLQSFLATVPYVRGVGGAERSEGHWQQMLYVIFSLLGAMCDVEVRTPRGRVDIVARTAAKLYIIEVKLNRSSEAAMRQIDLRDYAARFALCGLPIVKVGVNFDQDERNITDWTVADNNNA